MDFLSSTFKPIFVFVKIFGLQLDNDWDILSLSNFSRILRIYCILSLIINLVINGAMAASVWEWAFGLIILQDSIFVHARRILTARLVNILCHQIVLSAVPIIFYVNIQVIKNWKNLWLNILVIQEDMKLTNDFSRRCKRRFYFTFFLFSLVYGTIKKSILHH